MKKSILIAILISAAITAGAYYYFFIMTAPDESQQLPSKVKLVVKIPESATSEKPATDKTAKEATVPTKSGKKEELKKQEAKKEEPTKVEQKKAEPGKVEPHKTEPVAKDKKEVVKEPVKEEKKTVTQAPEKRIVAYYLVYAAKNEEEADKVKNLLLSNGYHTAKKVSKKGQYYVKVSPFTDKWEAEYVGINIEKETQFKFSVKPVYR